MHPLDRILFLHLRKIANKDSNYTIFQPAVVTTPAPFTCNYGLSVCCQAGAYQCGHRYPPPPGSTAAGAGQAEFGEYPWQAALLTTSEVYLGSGALITTQHVLTVAHKVYNVA